MTFDLLNAMARIKEEFGNDAELQFSQNNSSITMRLIVWHGDQKSWQDSVCVTRADLSQIKIDDYMDKVFENQIERVNKYMSIFLQENERK